MNYFEHNARRKRDETAFDVVEWEEPIVVEESDDEDTVEIVRIKWMERVQRVSD